MNNFDNKFSIILPTFNEAGHIKSLIFEIYEIFLKNSKDFEIIVVDDNSTDGTIKEIENIIKTKEKVKFLLRQNKKGSLVESLNEGIQSSKYENLIWMDADFSHPPSYLKKIIFEKEKNDYDVIVFSRFLKLSERYYDKEKSKPVFIDYLSIFLNKICSSMLFKNFTDYTSGYICIKKDIFKNYRLRGYYGDYFINLIVLCFLLKKNIIEFPYTEERRFSGFSKTTFSKIGFIKKCYFYFVALVRNKFKIMLK